MRFLVLGTSLNTTQMENLDRYFFDASRKARLAEVVAEKLPQLSEMVILQTCNRLEIYFSCEGDFPEELNALIAQVLKLDVKEVQLSFLKKEGIECIRHLFLVVSSLDSVIVGETQILGQVKDAYLEALESKSLGKYLQRLFEAAVRAGKRVRTETAISKGAVSISQAAVELGKKFFSSYDGVKVLVLGAGEMGRLAYRHLMSSGASEVYLANRTYARAQELVEELGGVSLPLEEVENVIAEVDLVVSALSYEGHFLKYDQMSRIMEKRRYSSLFAIDISMPRTLDPALNDLEQMFLFDIEDLKEVVDRNLKERLASRNQVEKIIEEEMLDFQNWLERMKMSPTLQSLDLLKKKFIEQELQVAQNKMKSGQDSELVMQRLARNLSSKYMHLLYTILSEIPNSDLQRHEVQKIVNDLLQADSKKSQADSLQSRENTRKTG